MTSTSVRDTTLAELSRRLRESDEDALAALFRALRADLLRYARSRLSDTSAADDLVQDAFLQLWHHRRGLDPDRSVRAYLYAAVRNLAANHDGRVWTRTRLLSRTYEGRRDASPHDAGSTIDAGHLGARILDWMAELPERRREAFELSRFAGLSLKEIAAVMQISTKTAEKHVGAALKHLRDRIRAYDPDILRP